MADAVDRGLALLERGTFEEALRILGRAARNNALDADAQHAYGLALHRTRQYAQAVEQFGRADRLKPDRWEVHQNLSAAYHGLEDYDASYAEAMRVLELRPGYSHALYHLGDLHQVWGEMPEAVAYYDRALETDPQNPDIWLGKLFALDLIDGVTPEQALAARRACAAVFENLARPYLRPHANRPDPDRRLRIGYISGDFRDHTAAYMFGPLYEHHDRDRYMVYSYSAVRQPDSVTAWFRTLSNGWRGILDCEPRTIAECIREDGIDILIDTAGYTNGGHLPVFAYKPAPLAVQAFGYLTGSGFEAMDAILVDDVLMPPEHEAHFTERPLRVPYALGFGGINGTLPIEPRPEGSPLTFGHLGRSDKASRGAVALWSRALRAYPESRMLLKDRGLRFERTRARLLGWFAEEGIAPERIDLRGMTSRGEHLAAYNDVDVVLDSVPQGGGTTTIEALWMGTPVVTIAGPRIIGRIAATTLAEIGHDDWIAADEDEYVRLAGLAAQQGGPGLRGEIASSAVFDGKARTRAFEQALRDLWRTWCSQQRMVA
jgi:predicted O-linked N-acetylglucosamine transferase (SPINDLY family)